MNKKTQGKIWIRNVSKPHFHKKMNSDRYASEFRYRIILNKSKFYGFGEANVAPHRAPLKYALSRLLYHDFHFA